MAPRGGAKREGGANELELDPPLPPAPPPLLDVVEELGGLGCTLLESLELEAWHAEVGVARVTQGWISTSSVVNL